MLPRNCKYFVWVEELFWGLFNDKCLMWLLWIEQNHWIFEDAKRSRAQLKLLPSRTLFEWASVRGLTNCHSLKIHLDYDYSHKVPNTNSLRK